MEPTLKNVPERLEYFVETYGGLGETLTEILRKFASGLIEHANETCVELDPVKFQYDWGEAKCERDVGSTILTILALFGDQSKGEE